MEDVNPARRYKWFRPRQAAFGSLFQGSATNLATISLFNNGGGSQLLALRDQQIPLLAGTLAFCSLQQGSFGTHTGVEQPMVANAPAPPGQVFYIDTATTHINGWLMGNAAWSHDFPLAIILPGWSWMVQSRIGAQNLAVSFIWEAIEADQLDFLYQDF